MPSSGQSLAFGETLAAEMHGDGTMMQLRCEQRSLSGPDQHADNLIPAGGLSLRFRELVWPVIDGESFASLCHKTHGWPAMSPALLAMATILQHRKNLHGREREAASKYEYDIRIRYARGRSIAERLFDLSSKLQRNVGAV